MGTFRAKLLNIFAKETENSEDGILRNPGCAGLAAMLASAGFDKSLDEIIACIEELGWSENRNYDSSDWQKLCSRLGCEEKSEKVLGQTHATTVKGYKLMEIMQANPCQQDFPFLKQGESISLQVFFKRAAFYRKFETPTSIPSTDLSSWLHLEGSPENELYLWALLKGEIVSGGALQTAAWRSLGKNEKVFRGTFIPEVLHLQVDSRNRYSYPKFTLFDVILIDGQIPRAPIYIYKNSCFKGKHFSKTVVVKQFPLELVLAVGHAIRYRDLILVFCQLNQNSITQKREWIKIPTSANLKLLLDYARGQLEIPIQIKVKMILHRPTEERLIKPAQYGTKVIGSVWLAHDVNACFQKSSYPLPDELITKVCQKSLQFYAADSQREGSRSPRR